MRSHRTTDVSVAPAVFNRFCSEVGTLVGLHVSTSRKNVAVLNQAVTDVSSSVIEILKTMAPLSFDTSVTV